MSGEEVEIGGKAAEYLEKLVAEGFKRELDQEENVVRSLPFFATSIGVLVAFIGLARPALPAASADLVSLLAYILLVAVILCLALLLVFIFQAVWHRTFTYPMNERALIDYAGDLTVYYRSAALEATDENGKKAAGGARNGELDQDVLAEAMDKAVVADLRRAMTDQLAVAAMKSRENNAKRLRARAKAFAALILALSFALALIVTILIVEAPDGGSNAQGRTFGRNIAERDVPGPQDRAVPDEAQGAGHAGGREGVRDVPGGQSFGAPSQGR